MYTINALSNDSFKQMILWWSKCWKNLNFYKEKIGQDKTKSILYKY